MESAIIFLWLACFTPLLGASLRDNGRLAELFHQHDLLDYRTDQLLEAHQRVKRGSSSQERSTTLSWSFSAFNRYHRVQMKPNSRVFSPEFSVSTQDESTDFDTNRVYHGHVVGWPASQVSGVLLKDGRFEGRIFTSPDELFIERVEHFIPQNISHNSSQLPAFHSVAYRIGDVKMHKKGNVTCRVEKLMKSMAGEHPGVRGHSYKEISRPHDLYNRPKYKRAIDSQKTMCEMYVQADHLYYQKWDSNIDTVIELIINYFSAVNQIYRVIDFDGDGSADEVNFAIKKLKVWTDSTAADYPFADNLDVSNYLERFSAQDNYNDFCLAYTFTHRDFNDGTLGLAWTADSEASGGVCEKYGVFNGVSMSLNTGIVTTLNFQQEVVFGVSQLTLAHELGHSLGSGHDDEGNELCAPGSEGGGNYIMFAKATDGDKANNRQFSTCSISSMRDVMTSVARHDGTEACFKVYTDTLCGNKVVEPGEDCDCGWDDECGESCCNPQMSNYDPSVYSPCTYTAAAVCSPSEGACCADNCQPRLTSDNYECRSEGACSQSAFCNGTATCPQSEAKSNGTDCAAAMVCLSGECSTSVCEAFGYKLCQCTPDVSNDWNDEKLCQLCCLDGGSCKLSSDIPDITKSTEGATGQPCYGYQGYCDIFLKCRQLDPVGTINSLKRALFTEEGQATVTEWVKANWYIPAASLLGFIILLAISVKLGAKHEPVIPPNKVSPK